MDWIGLRVQTPSPTPYIAQSLRSMALRSGPVQMLPGKPDRETPLPREAILTDKAGLLPGDLSIPSSIICGFFRTFGEARSCVGGDGIELAFKPFAVLAALGDRSSRGRTSAV